MPIIRMKKASPFVIEIVDDAGNVVWSCDPPLDPSRMKWRIVKAKDNGSVVGRPFQMLRTSNGDVVEIQLGT